jgi:bacterioferritin-associated ferredoxin
MYICLCNAVSDRDIKDAVANGAHDLASIQTHLGAGMGCGTCQETTKALIDALQPLTLDAVQVTAGR